MTRRNLLLLIVALAMIGATAGLLQQLQGHQRLGPPGVKTSPLEGSTRLRVELPERVLDYTSEFREPDDLVLRTLPKDTSFGHRIYKAGDGFEISLSAVLMGTDRTSIHKPQICLSGFGWHLDDTPSMESAVQIERPSPWELPVARLVGTKEVMVGGQPVMARCVYVYWFVAENVFTAKNSNRMWWMARDLLRTGVLQRWAYISCLAICQPGQEEQVYERIKSFIAAAVPEFQLATGNPAITQTKAPAAPEANALH